MRLSDVQRAFRGALVTGDPGPLLPALRGPGGRSASGRLAIYLRHYEASLVDALMQRFQATAWLIGSDDLEQAARQYVRQHPPHAPCIAEYGEGLPTLLDNRPHRSRFPAGDFARLDWALGRLAVGVDEPALTASSAQAMGDELPRCLVRLQSATWYGSADTAIDELMARYLDGADDTPTPLTPGPVWIEARGHRGALRCSRLPHDTFAFRHGLARGLSLEAAAEAALAVDATFAPGAALAALFQDGLVTSLTPATGDQR